MMHYSIKSRYGIFVKDYGFLFFAKDMFRNIGKNVSTKFSRKLLNH